MDLPRQRIVLSRDRFSIKPLYVLRKSSCLYFASEIKQLLPLLDSVEPNVRVLNTFLDQLLLDYCEDTFYQGIRRLRACTNIVINLTSGEMAEGEYWTWPEANESPLSLAEAFLADLTARLRPLFPAGLYRTALPDSLAGLAVVVLDGKKIKKAAKRLLATRGRPGKLYGGKVLAAYLPAEGLVVALAADPDGEANDIRLVPRVLPVARAAVAGPRLWVADRQFGDLDQPGRCGADGDHFLIRYSTVTSFHPDPARPDSVDLRPGERTRSA